MAPGRPSALTCVPAASADVTGHWRAPGGRVGLSVWPSRGGRAVIGVGQKWPQNPPLRPRSAPATHGDPAGTLPERYGWPGRAGGDAQQLEEPRRSGRGGGQRRHGSRLAPVSVKCGPWGCATAIRPPSRHGGDIELRRDGGAFAWEP